MARGTFLNGDICIYLSEGEILNLGQLKIKGNELFHPPLEVLLDTNDSKDLKAIVRKEGFECLGGGIKVNRTNYGFLVKVNHKTYWRLINNKSYGTIYCGNNKINFFKV